MKKTLVFLLLLSGSYLVSTQSTCSFDGNSRVPRNQLSSCLTSIKQAAQDGQAYWYGRDYSTNCPNPSADVNCKDGPLLSTGTNLVNRVLFSYLDDLDRFLYITYTSPPGSYQNQCGHNETFPSSTQFSLNPLNETDIAGWYTREQPVIQWEAQQSQLFTLLLADTGTGQLNFAAVNIRGSDISSGQVIQSYRSPLNYRKWVTPFVFMLFTQSRPLPLDDYLRQQLTQDNQPFDIYNFQYNQRLTGPVALNWLKSAPDAYSVGYWAANRDIQNCGSLIQKVLEDRDLPFMRNIPASRQSVYLTVEYEVDDYTVNSCCRQYNYPGGSFILDPIGNGSIVPAYTRGDSRRRYRATYDTERPSNDDFQGKLYTFMMLDPSTPAPFTVFGTRDRPMLHGMDVNMVRQPDGSFVGESPYPYLAPAPPSAIVNGSYFFLMFEQQQPLSNLDTTRYALDACQRFSDRCNFDLGSFTRDYDLSFLGATWMVVPNDAYVNVSYINLGDDRGARCNYIPGYDSCQDNSPSSDPTQRTSTGQTPCSFDANGSVPQNRLSSCLTEVKQAAQDDQAYWYGRDYSSNCPNPSADVNCKDGPLLSTGTDLVNRVLFSYLDDLNRFLYVTYTSPPGSYQNQCRHSETYTSSERFTLNPLNETGIVGWYTREQPVIKWEAQQSELFTLILADTATGLVNYAVINIRGSDINSGQVIQQYRSPNNYRKWVTPFVFMLFTQNRPLQLDNNWQQQLTQENRPVDLYNFQYTQSLSGPVAINWLRSAPDAYSVGSWASSRDVHNCGSLVFNALEQKDIPFLRNVPTSQQTAYFTVEYQVDDYAIETCCRRYSYPGGTFVLDPIGNKSITPAYTRADSKRKYIVSYDTERPSGDDFRGKLYTFMMLDPSTPAPYTVFGTWDRPMLHGMDVNMVRQPDGSFVGESPYPYLRPAPPTTISNGNYFFVMLEQRQPMSNLDTTRYALDACQRYTDRCNFDFESFAWDNGLSLLGVTWMVVPNDAYVNASYIALGDDRGARCNYIPGYNSCQDNSISIPAGQSTTISPTDGSSWDSTQITLLCVLPPPALAAVAYALYYYYYRF